MKENTMNKYLDTLRDIVRSNRALIPCLRAIYGPPGKCFDFAHPVGQDGYSFALAAAKADGEQSVIALLESLNKEHHA